MTDQQRLELERRQAGFDRFFEEMMPVLTDFMGQLGLPDPPMVLQEAERFVSGVDLWLSDQEIGPDDWRWVVTRIGYFIGELLVQKFGGCWFVHEVPTSRYFARYVVGQFKRPVKHGAVVDPFEVAASYLSQPKGRRLTHVVKEVEAELMEEQRPR